MTSSSVGANVKVFWHSEEWVRLHYAPLQVPWSFVGRLRDEAEKNETGGMMTVDLAALRQDGVPVFNEDFPSVFRGVFVHRFVPCLNEKFNQRDPNKPLTTLPDDVEEAFRLLVLCEKLKAALKQDVKDHLDRLVVRAGERGLRANEGAPFKIVHATLELDPTVPCRGSLQERVVHRATEMLSAGLPETMDALQELIQLACELGRTEMCTRLFRSAVEKALTMPARTLPVAGGVLSAAPTSIKTQQDAEGSDKRRYQGLEDAKRTEDDRYKVTQEMEALQRAKREFAEERARFEQYKASNNGEQQRGSNLFPVAIPQRRAPEIPDHNSTTSEENSFSTHNMSSPGVDQKPVMVSGNVTAVNGSLALRQGVVLEKVGRNTGDRIVRMVGDVLEWRKGSGRFTKDHTVFRHDVVSVKTVDPSGKTFLLSTRTGLLTLRALNEPAAQMFVQAIEQWVKGSQAQAPMGRMMATSTRLPQPMMAAPSMMAPQFPIGGGAAPPPSFISRRFPRISMSFRKPSEETRLAAPMMPNMSTSRNNDMSSFVSGGAENSFLRDDE